MAKTLYRELAAILRANGFDFERYAKGDHEIWSNRTTNKSVSVDRGVQSRHTANGILRAAGLPKHF